MSWESGLMALLGCIGTAVPLYWLEQRMLSRPRNRRLLNDWGRVPDPPLLHTWKRCAGCGAVFAQFFGLGLREPDRCRRCLERD